MKKIILALAVFLNVVAAHATGIAPNFEPLAIYLNSQNQTIFVALEQQESTGTFKSIDILQPYRATLGQGASCLKEVRFYSYNDGTCAYQADVLHSDGKQDITRNWIVPVRPDFGLNSLGRTVFGPKIAIEKLEARARCKRDFERVDDYPEYIYCGDFKKSYSVSHLSESGRE